ncbi:cache domain-containing protein [Helicobacter burdigaliensis]|uniref:cache domain-containing protein n=1 Tax=Helicobacter burdigaliensis TaxID=2315334 RepID=UPI000EF65CAD|nr:cache domain-containing protein [Helicobacter burdigaliensis]
MESSMINLLNNYMPLIKSYRSQFTSLNTLLGKTTLTGKISSLDIAENLFEYMEQTQEKFENLQEKLIDTIMEQSFLNKYEEAYTSVCVILDQMENKITKCTQEVAMFVASRYILKCCQKEEFEELKKYFNAFLESHQVYKDILLYDLQGNIKFSTKFEAKNTKNIEIAGYSEKYKDCFGKIDFYPLSNEEAFYFVAPIKKEENAYLSLIFIIDLEKIFFDSLKRYPYSISQAVLILANQKNQIIYSDDSRNFPVGGNLNLHHHKEYSFIESHNKLYLNASKSFENVPRMQDWKVYRVVPLLNAFEQKKGEEFKIEKKFLENSLLITEDLDSVITEAENINEDLGDVVINGEIIASKSHSYALNPILNNIRILSEEMNTLCVQSTEELQKGIYEALFNVVGYYSRYSSYSVLDLFLMAYNDVHWIRKNDAFKDFAQECTKEDNRILTCLKRFKQESSIYHNILAYDANGVVVANGCDIHALNGQKVAICDRVSQSVTYKNNLFVSGYEKTPFYAGDKTIIFYTPLVNSNRIVGGLAFVLEGNIFKDILLRTLSKESSILSEESEIFSILLDANLNLYASTKEDFSFEAFNFEEIDLASLRDKKQIFKFKERYYLVSVQMVVSDCEDFKMQDIFRTPLYNVVFVAIKDEEKEF